MEAQVRGSLLTGAASSVASSGSGAAASASAAFHTYKSDLLSLQIQFAKNFTCTGSGAGAAAGCWKAMGSGSFHSPIASSTSISAAWGTGSNPPELLDPFRCWVGSNTGAWERN
jgi:hypothetical protein